MGKGRNRSRRPPSKPPYQVFISHATADKWLAMTLCEKIEATGATTFRDDRDIKGGDSIPDEVFKQIARSRELVVLMTPVSVTRPWVLLEIGAACRDKRMRIVPILYHVGIDPIPDMIKQKKAFSLNEVETFLSELRSRMKARQA